MEYLQYFVTLGIWVQFSFIVLNLIINGIPSIHQVKDAKAYAYDQSFKPYYKWNTFNTVGDITTLVWGRYSFKPYYKWNTFNTIET